MSIRSGVRICSYDLMRKEFTKNGSQALPVLDISRKKSTCNECVEWKVGLI